MASEHAIRLGETVKTLRVAVGMTLEDLGAQVGLHKSSVSRIERGEAPGLPLSTLLALAEFFGVPPGSLIDGSAAVATPQITVGVAQACEVTCAVHGLLAAGLTADKARQVRAEHLRQHLTGQES